MITGSIVFSVPVLFIFLYLAIGSDIGYWFAKLAFTTPNKRKGKITYHSLAVQAMNEALKENREFRFFVENYPKIFIACVMIIFAFCWLPFLCRYFLPAFFVSFYKTWKRRNE